MNQAKSIRISNTEWHILHVLWSRTTPTQMKDIVRALNHTPWSRTTIQTMVNRLMKKGLINANKAKYAFDYYPAVTKEEAQDYFIKSALDRVYDGDKTRFMESIAEGDFLTSDEKKSFKKML